MSQIPVSSNPCIPTPWLRKTSNVGFAAVGFHQISFYFFRQKDKMTKIKKDTYDKTKMIFWVSSSWVKILAEVGWGLVSVWVGETQLFKSHIFLECCKLLVFKETGLCFFFSFLVLHNILLYNCLVFEKFCNAEFRNFVFWLNF